MTNGWPMARLEIVNTDLMDLPSQVKSRTWWPRLRFSRRIFGHRHAVTSADMEIASVAGTCLAPFLTDGDIAIFSRVLEPRDRDVVLVSMKYKRYTATIGLPPQIMVRRSVKQFRLVDGKAWLCSAEGSVDASYHEITGVAFAWCRVGMGRFTWRKPMRKMDFVPAETIERVIP